MGRKQMNLENKIDLVMVTAWIIVGLLSAWLFFDFQVESKQDFGKPFAINQLVIENNELGTIAVLSDDGSHVVRSKLGDD